MCVSLVRTLSLSRCAVLSGYLGYLSVSVNFVCVCMVVVVPPPLLVVVVVVGVVARVVGSSGRVISESERV